MKYSGKHTIDNQNGFTLIEVLIASAIFVIGILGVLTMFSTTIHSNDLARRTLEATTFAAEKIEELKSIPFGNIDSAGNGADSPDGHMARTYTTTSTNIDDLKKITVSVTWTTGTGNSKNVTLTTTRAKD